MLGDHPQSGRDRGIGEGCIVKLMEKMVKLRTEN